MSLLLAILSGVLSFLAFPRFGWWPLIVVCQVPLMVALRDKGTRRRLVYGWLTGTVFVLGMQYWVAGTLVAMSQFPWWLALISLCVYALFVGFQWALFAILYAPLRRWSGRRGWILTVPLLYVLIEQSYPALFPFSLSNALFEVPVLLQTAEWFGVAGPTWLIMLTSCAIVSAIEDIQKRRANDHLILTATAALWLLILVLGVARMRQTWSAPVQGRPTVALVQPNVTIAEKTAKDRHVREFVYERTAAMTREASGTRPDLVVWPEGGFPFRFQPRVGKENRNQRYSRRLQSLALELGVDFMAGSLRNVEGGTTNSVIHIPPGERVGIYDKQRLLLFGERVPLGDTFPSLRERIPGMSHYISGKEHKTFVAAGFNWVVGLCYETIFADFTREALNKGDGGDFLLNFTNDVWFGDTSAAEQHLMLQSLRSIENRVWLIRSTNSGISALVDPTGTVRSRTSVGESTVLVAEIDHLSLDRPFFRKHGNLLLYLAALLCFLALVLKNRHPLRNNWPFRVVKNNGSEDVDGG